MEKSLDKLFRGVEILIGIFLAVMIGLTFMNVVLRFFFSLGFSWSEEVARLCFIYLVYLGTIGAYRDNQHLGVEMLVEKASPFFKKLLYTLIQGMVIWMMVWLTIGSWQLAVQGLNDRWVATQYPRFLVNGIGVVTGVSITLIALANLYKLFALKRPVLELMKPVDSDPDHAAAMD